MKLKRIAISSVMLLLFCTLLLLSCSSDPSASDSKDSTVSDETTTGSSAEELKSFTREELAKYNGKDGNPAYIAVDGTVYDVTDVPQWKDGEHADKYEAGKDVTKELNTQAPHSASKMDGVPVVGIYTD
jgi:predicted heme/steroid binding protein